MKVTLINYTPEPERTIATAAKLCYSSSDIESLQEGLDQEKIQKFIEMLMELGHESPVEHVSFTFGVEGISRACSHQLVRHRIASYSQKSQRYVPEKQFDYITPDTIEEDLDTKLEYEDCMMKIQEHYDSLRNKLIKKNMAEGMDPKHAEKKANEDARYVLPNACETKIVVTMNVRSLFNFFKHRCCNRAQWEIREVAMQMYKICMEIAPSLFRHAGPDCVAKGQCSEGRMTCGEAMQMRNMFARIHADIKEKDNDLIDSNK